MRNLFRWLSRNTRPEPTPARHRRPDPARPDPARTSPTGPVRTDSTRPGTARHDSTRPVGAGNPGRYYRSAAYRPLCPERVRGRQFSLVRRGLDPHEVDVFLDRVAEELAALRAELDRTRDENNRIKRTLRDWQSHFAPRVYR